MGSSHSCYAYDLSTRLFYGVSGAVIGAAVCFYILNDIRSKAEKEEKINIKIFGALADSNTNDLGAGITAKKTKTEENIIKHSHKDLLGDIIVKLWSSSIRPSLSHMINEILTKLLTDMFPSGLLSTLHITKFDLGSAPIRLENSVVHEVSKDSRSCQFDADVLWDGNCDITIGLPRLGKIGIKSLKFIGRISFVMGPLKNRVPCMSAISYTFLNPPHLVLDFYGLATLVEFSAIDEKVMAGINQAITSIMVLPHRMYFKLDEKCKLCDAYKAPYAIIRLYIPWSRGFKVKKKLLKSDDVPDMYARVTCGDRTVTTSTVKNCVAPSWKGEQLDFIVHDYSQSIRIDMWDKNSGRLEDDGEEGSTSITIRELLMATDRDCQLELFDNDNDEPTGAKINVSADILPLASSANAILSGIPANIITKNNKNALKGMMTVIVERAFNIPVESAEAAQTMVKVKVDTQEPKDFATGVVIHDEGIDALNPVYDCIFEIPLDNADVACEPSITLTLVQKNKSADDEEIVLGETTIDWNQIKDAGFIRETKRMGKVDCFCCASLEFGLLLHCEQDLIDTDEAKFRKEELENEVNLHTETHIVSSTIHDTEQIISDTIHQSVEQVERTRCVRITPVAGRGFKIINRGPFRKKDIPDVYLKIKLGSEGEEWVTSVIRNCVTPEWNESKVFNFSDVHDTVYVAGWDKNKGSLTKDDLYGRGILSVNKTLLQGGEREMELIDKKGKATGLFITIQCTIVQ